MTAGLQLLMKAMKSIHAGAGLPHKKKHTQQKKRRGRRVTRVARQASPLFNLSAFDKPVSSGVLTKVRGLTMGDQKKVGTKLSKLLSSSLKSLVKSEPKVKQEPSVPRIPRMPFPHHSSMPPLEPIDEDEKEPPRSLIPIHVSRQHSPKQFGFPFKSYKNKDGQGQGAGRYISGISLEQGFKKAPPR